MTAQASTLTAPPTLKDAFVTMARAELRQGNGIRAITETVEALTLHLAPSVRDVHWFELKHSLSAQDLADAGHSPWYENGVRWDIRVTEALAILGGAR